jgi:hypothetical protein
MAPSSSSSTAAAPKKSEKSYLTSTIESISPWATGARSATPKEKEKEEEATAAKQAAQRGGDHSVGHAHGISTRRYPEDCPALKTRWFYAVDVRNFVDGWQVLS